MHAEMPRQNPDGSANVGMQLWVDLPEKLKFCEPRYRDLRASEIPKVDVDEGKVHIKVISGQSHGVDSVRDLAYTPVWILDIEIKPGGKVVQQLPEGWNAFAYTLDGSTTFGKDEDKTKVGKFHNVVFEQKGDVVHAEVEKDAEENGHFSKFHFHNPFHRSVLQNRREVGNGSKMSTSNRHPAIHNPVKTFLHNHHSKSQNQSIY
jgi:redox-sensitive bicupin YhaK (pirin superfamily)